jgi:membrane associated rhomboid family serine protease
VPIVIYPLFVQIPALVYLGLWFLLQLWSGVSAFGQGPAAGGIAWWAHIGGFVAGIVLLKLLVRPEPQQLPGPARHLVYPALPARGHWR